jgi:hypothetical protein
MERVHQRRSPPGNPIMVSMTRIPGGMLMRNSFPHDSAGVGDLRRTESPSGTTTLSP